MKKVKFKDILIYIVSIICITSLFSYEFFPKFSNKFLNAKKSYFDSKKENKEALNKVKEYSKNSPAYKKYLIVNQKYKSSTTHYKKMIEEEKVFGFDNLQIFLSNFGKFFCFFVYALFLLIHTFYTDNKNIALKILHTVIISGTIFYFIWIFNPKQDIDIIGYYLMSFFTGISISIGVYFFTKRRKTKIQKLEVQNIEAGKVIDELEKEVLIKQEEQRAKVRQQISEELHDGILGKLFGTRMGLGFLNQPNDQNREKHQQFLNELQEIEKEIREVSHKLSTNLDGSDIDFSAIVEQLLKDKSIIGNFSYELTVDPEIQWPHINETNRVNLYRIIQEALQNIIKHANAKHVILIFKIQNNQIITSIKDDGVGFHVSKNKNGIGLHNINSRLKRIKGILEISSQPNKGTQLNLKFPYLINDALSA